MPGETVLECQTPDQVDELIIKTEDAEKDAGPRREIVGMRSLLVRTAVFSATCSMAWAIPLWQTSRVPLPVTLTSTIGSLGSGWASPWDRWLLFFCWTKLTPYLIRNGFFSAA
ncbi:hypothetical protein N7519_004060 [Penicillium mononematosum]|uniref:uncharacterized protein n=1 Tax=Penicillium mononematosum TaxID=268346 RepID=UPI002547D43D|nr:uncharacterized protein N7519_004060 [Penicillium mononematosum]KAJ6189152.1 hypothetical protein N7519_004060 [Penicillium mononematosum]